MKSARDKHPLRRSHEITQLRRRLAEAEETLRAVRSGEVDALVVSGKEGRRVFTLQGAEHAYRVLIESMNEGALTLTAGAVVLYANQCFARMVRRPLELVMGRSFFPLLSPSDQARLRPLLKKVPKSGSKCQVLLDGGRGMRIPALISIRRLAKNGFRHAPIGMVVTDMTEPRRTEEQLRALTHRMVRAQESERGRVALELHDHIIQLLCAIQFRSQALADNLSAHEGPPKKDARELRDMVGGIADEVERISRNLRPGVLDQLGLNAVMRDASDEFAKRTGVSISLACVELAVRLPQETELTFYRVLQEALRNIERHAGARRVSVRLRRRDGFIQMMVADDGVGFEPEDFRESRGRAGGLGLLGMRERAAYAGGTFTIKSSHLAGTEIDVRIPFSPRRRNCLSPLFSGA